MPLSEEYRRRRDAQARARDMQKLIRDVLRQLTTQYPSGGQGFWLPGETPQQPFQGGPGSGLGAPPASATGPTGADVGDFGSGGGPPPGADMVGMNASGPGPSSGGGIPGLLGGLFGGFSSGGSQSGFGQNVEGGTTNASPSTGSSTPSSGTGPTIDMGPTLGSSSTPPNLSALEDTHPALADLLSRMSISFLNLEPTNRFMTRFTIQPYLKEKLEQHILSRNRASIADMFGLSPTFGSDPMFGTDPFGSFSQDPTASMFGEDPFGVKGLLDALDAAAAGLGQGDVGGVAGTGASGAIGPATADMGETGLW